MDSRGASLGAGRLVWLRECKRGSPPLLRLLARIPTSGPRRIRGRGRWVKPSRGGRSRSVGTLRQVSAGGCVDPRTRAILLGCRRNNARPQWDAVSIWLQERIGGRSGSPSTTACPAGSPWSFGTPLSCGDAAQRLSDASEAIDTRPRPASPAATRWNGRRPWHPAASYQLPRHFHVGKKEGRA